MTDRKRVHELELRAIVAAAFDIRAVTNDDVLIRAFQSTAESVRIMTREGAR